MTTSLTGPDEYIDCGDSKVYDVVGADGETRKIRIIAGSAQPSGDSGKKPEPSEAGAGGGLIQPDFPHGATARITATVLGQRDITDARFHADLFVDPGIAPTLVPGARIQVPMWRITDFSGGRVTLLLPEGQGDVTSGGMIFVPELGQQ